MRENGKYSALSLVQFSILLAVEAAVCFTPWLGSIPALGPIVMTTAHIPVIITAILLGWKAGTAMGLCAGVFSLIIWSFFPPPVSAPVAFVFSPFYRLGEYQGNIFSLLISVVPRTLIGTVAGLTFAGVKRMMPAFNAKSSIFTYSIAAVAGSLTNTFLVLGGIWVFFGKPYESILGQPILMIVSYVTLTSGIPEAIIAAVCASAVCGAVSSYNKRRPQQTRG